MIPYHRLASVTLAAWASIVAVSVYAQDAPKLTPRNDTVIDYKVIKGASQESAARLRLIYTDAGKLVRLDRFIFADAHVPFQTTLYDADASRQFILLYQNQLCLEYVADSLTIPGLTFEPATHFIRERIDTVASLPCTVWRLEGSGPDGTVCNTNDGVILRSEQPDRILEATAVSNKIPPNTFTVPADLYRIVTGVAPKGGETSNKGPSAR